MKENVWVGSDNADNAVATASRAAKADGYHVVDYVSASFSAASVIALLTITATIGGASVTVTYYVHTADQIPLGLKCDPNTAVSAALAASGTGGVIGRVNMVGHTE